MAISAGCKYLHLWTSVVAYYRHETVIVKVNLLESLSKLVNLQQSKPSTSDLNLFSNFYASKLLYSEVSQRLDIGLLTYSSNS